MDNVREYIRSKVGVLELLAGLAEEAAELAQAALKYRRALTGVNPTPISKEEAYGKLLAEIADVQLYESMLDIDWLIVDDIKDEKAERWVQRLEQKKQQEQITDYRPEASDTCGILTLKRIRKLEESVEWLIRYVTMNDNAISDQPLAVREITEKLRASGYDSHLAAELNGKRSGTPNNYKEHKYG